MYILASQSLRRIELLKQLNIDFETIPSRFDEESVSCVEITSYVETLAYQKARKVFNDHPYKKVIGADTVIYFKNAVYGKPKDELDAFNMLKTLSGETHAVYTGMSIVSKNKVVTTHDVAKVTFRQLSDEEILAYVNTQEPMDKSGSYAIQGLAKSFVSHIEGDIETIIGLSTNIVRHLIKEVDL
jgi:septum formation protein